MAVTTENSASGTKVTGSSGTTFTVDFGFTPTAGNALVFFFACPVNATLAEDSGDWTLEEQYNGSILSGYLWYKENCSASDTSITINRPFNFTASWCAIEASGAKTSGAVDANGSAEDVTYVATTTNTITTGTTGTRSTANGRAYGFVMIDLFSNWDSNTGSWSGSWSEVVSGSIGTTAGLRVAELAVSSTAAQSGTYSGWTDANDECYGAIIIIDEAGGGAFTLTADTGTFTLTGQSANLTAARKLTADAATFELTGQAANFVRGYAFPAEVGAFTLTGQDAGLTAQRKVTADAGSFELTGSAVILTFTPVSAIGVPANLTGTPDTDSIVWEWDAVSGATGYEIEYGPDGGGYTVTDVGDTLTYTQTSLTAATLYEARVRAYVDSWTPAELFASSEVGVWYDPSDFDTMWKDTAGTTPVTAVDDLVARIDDKSGNGFHATQATEARRPVLKQDGNGNYYLLFDGTDDSLATSSIDFSVSDEVSLFAGLRKLSDAAQGILCELSTTVGSNTGTFYLTAPESTTTRFGSYGRGDATISSTQRVTGAGDAPITAVIHVSHDISGDLGKMRVNTVASTNATGDKGAGNFGNYPLYIGRRAGTSVPFNGWFYSLIVRSALSTSDEINEAEAWVNAKTEAY